MFESRTIDHLHMLSRQFDGLAEQGVGTEDALQRIADTVPPAYAEDAARLRALIAGGDDSVGLPTVGASPYGRLAELIEHVPPGGKHRVSLLRDFSDYVTQTRIVADTYWAGFSGFVLYAVALVLVAALVAGIFAFNVVPSLRGLFESMGGELPPFTAALLGGEQALPGVIMGLSFAVAALIVSAGIAVRGRLQRLAPLPGWITLLPGMNALRRSWQRDLYLNTLRLLRRAGVGDETARTAAAKSSGFDAARTDHDRALEALAIAQPLGLLDRELDTQCTDHVTRLTDDLLAARNRIALATKLILYATIALLIIATYQPLFQMGGII